jgi:hypothetical protein
MGAPAYVLGRRLEHTINVSAKIVSGSARTWRRSISSTVVFPLGKDCGGSRNGYCWGGFWIYTSASKA